MKGIELSFLQFHVETAFSYLHVKPGQTITQVDASLYLACKLGWPN